MPRGGSSDHARKKSIRSTSHTCIVRIGPGCDASERLEQGRHRSAYPERVKAPAVPLPAVPL